MRNLILLTVISLSGLLNAQKYNYQWLFGYDEFTGNPQAGLSVLDFNNGVVTIDYWAACNHDLGGESSFVCDEESGEIALFTNGCHVWEEEQNSLTGEAFLMDDWASPYYCPEEHPTRNARLLLPSLQNDSVFYLVQKDVNYVEGIGVRSERLFVHTIENPNDGLYELTSTNVVLDTPLLIGHLTAGPNFNRDGWWFSVVEHETNRHFMYELGGDSLISEPVIHTEGPIGDQTSWDIGQAAFSPNMTIWANSTEDNGIMLFDFDNATGQLSNYREIHYPDMETAEGLCFSPNSRYIYMTTAVDIYQIDLAATDPAEQVYHIADVRFPSPDDGWPVGLGYMHLGPDCRIYISPGTTSQYLHVIHNPNGHQEQCMLDVGAIYTPTHIAHHLPNLPNYYYLNGCDPDIAWGIPVSTNTVTTENEWTVFPNPVRSKIILQRENFAAGNQHWSLFNLQGIKVFETNLARQQQEIDLSRLPAGTYFWKIENTGQQGRLIMFD